MSLFHRMLALGMLCISLIGFSNSTFADELQELTAKAEQGDANAQGYLGYLYLSGKGVTQDYKQAFDWIQQAAKQGNSNAQFALGVMYYTGAGTAQNYQLAFDWVQQAAEQGNSKAQFTLGEMYHAGQGTIQDDQQALYWHTKAADQGYTKATREQEKKQRSIIGRNPWIFYWFFGLIGLYIAYKKFPFIQQIFKKKPSNYQLDAEQGDIDAQVILGLMHYNGEGTAQNYQHAFYWFTKAAEQGDSTAQNNLGVMYAHGQGTAQDYQHAIHWYTKAAEQGEAGAKYNLGVLYALGHGVTQNHQKAYMFFSVAIAEGLTEATEAKDDAAKELSLEQLAEAQAQATQYLEQQHPK